MLLPGERKHKLHVHGRRVFEGSGRDRREDPQWPSGAAGDCVHSRCLLEQRRPSEEFAADDTGLEGRRGPAQGDGQGHAGTDRRALCPSSMAAAAA